MSHPRIERVRIALVTAPLRVPIKALFGTVTTRHNILVRIETDDGCWGYGEAWGNFPPWGCRDRVDILLNVVRPALVGQPLDQPESLYDMLARKMRPLANQLGAAGPFQQALAGADIALWDNAARRAGVPLAAFIRGEAAPAAVEVYATNLPIDRPQVIEEMSAAGHTRFKFRIRGDDPQILEGLRDARAAAGGRPLMADATQSFPPAALWPLAPDLGELSLDWLEEPLLADDIESCAAWSRVPVRPPLAMGENSYRRGGFRHLLEVVEPEVLQPDITKTGGISEGRHIFRDILDAGKRACPHMYGGPVGLYASAHLSAAIGGMSWLEMDSLANPLFDLLLAATPEVSGGKLALPVGPGLGDLLRDDVFARFEI